MNIMSFDKTFLSLVHKIQSVMTVADDDDHWMCKEIIYFIQSMIDCLKIPHAHAVQSKIQKTSPKTGSIKCTEPSSLFVYKVTLNKISYFQKATLPA